MLKLNVVVVSTRPGRVGLAVGEWFHRRAVEHGNFEVTFVDLHDLALPLLDEPEHPRLRKYTKAHTHAWSKSVEGADAFTFVTPEYNFGLPPTLLNAIDFVYSEWNYKAASFVSYGGVSGGLRATQMAKVPLTSVKVMPIVEQVSISFVSKQITDGKFTPTDAQHKAAADMLDELHRWAAALKPMREAKR
ncbi:MAG TPA: NAD(P)H-dependent oxidoreductase [Myxococcaceae bacterium]|nr:NAD(P)H-dependent oxidoreductase [Myxococcaceae bacterium]